MADMTTDAPLIVIVGPTGVGKSALALELARVLPSEVISADSRQIYTGLDIGTAKVTPAEQAQVPHHLIDCVAPDEDFSLAEYQEQAYACLVGIWQRGRWPLLVGGTGQYVRAVVEGWRIPRVPPDPELRAELYAEAEQKGGPALYARLLALDPGAADLIDARNVRRVVRALEVCLATGRPFSEQRGKDPPPYDVLQVGLTMERQALYARVDARIQSMIERGLVDEVRSLVERGYDWTLPAMSSLGYIQFKGYLEGTASLSECVALTKKATRRFIRQQYNWFRLGDPRIRWIDVGQTVPGPQAVEWIQQRFGVVNDPSSV
jgi:tRNA dimethylallyltransferase